MQQKGVFNRFGVNFFNCYEKSGLRAFPYVPFEDALIDVCGLVEEVPDLAGFYEKESCKKCNTWHVRCDGNNWMCLDCNHTWKRDNE